MKKIIGIFICTLLIITAIPITGQVTESIISKDNDEINPLLEGNKWMKTFGGFNVDAGRSVLQTTDGGYIVSGWTLSFGAGDADVYIVKTDASGNQQWQETFGGSSVDAAGKVKQTADGGYIMAGRTQSYGAGGWDACLIKTD